jgi:hypothetical protein
MSGPNSVPNGDTRVMRGHMSEVFICDWHGKEVPGPESRCPKQSKDPENPCPILPLRWYLLKRNRLRTGKTK